MPSFRHSFIREKPPEAYAAYKVWPMLLNLVTHKELYYEKEVELTFQEAKRRAKQNIPSLGLSHCRYKATAGLSIPRSYWTLRVCMVYRGGLERETHKSQNHQESWLRLKRPPHQKSCRGIPRKKSEKSELKRRRETKERFNKMGSHKTEAGKWVRAR